MKIYKYTLKPTESQTVAINGTRILNAIEQNGDIVVYAIHEDAHNPVNYEFAMFATGQPIDFNLSDFTFLNTVEPQHGIMIHVFYRKNQ